MGRHGTLMLLTVGILCIGLASPARAGRWVLQYTPNAAISVKLEGDDLVGIVNPTFGPGRAGRLELRLAGVAIQRFYTPPYVFRLRVTEPVVPLRIEGQKGIEPFRIEPGLDYTLEAFVIQQGTRRRSAAPATTFRLVEELVTPSGAPPVGLSEEQLKQLLKEAYDEGFRRGQATGAPASAAPTPPRSHSLAYGTPAELRPAENFGPPSVPIGKVIVRLWDEKGLPTDGTVLLKFQGWEQRVEVHGQATVEMPSGAVTLQVEVRPGWTARNPGWVLAKGQKPEVKIQAGQTVVWDLCRVPKEGTR